jgi:hypothetical protein
MKTLILMTGMTLALSVFQGCNRSEKGDDIQWKQEQQEIEREEMEQEELREIEQRNREVKLDQERSNS